MSEIKENYRKYMNDLFDDPRFGCDERLRMLLEYPQRKISIKIPIVRCNGELSIYKAYRVQHNDARGPFKGGLRFNENCSLDDFEVFSSLMTWKTALLDIPFGGAKGGIKCDPKKLTKNELKEISKSFIEKMFLLIGPNIDVMAPDMETSENEMGWLFEAYSRINGYGPRVVTGKPIELGGLPGRIEATGKSISVVTRLAAKEHGISIDKATVAIQGFGKVGCWRHILNGAKIIKENCGVRMMFLKGLRRC